MLNNFTWWDIVVVVMLVALIVGLAYAFVRAGRSPLWRRLFLLWGLLFLGLEVVGGMSDNTLSENIVSSLPLEQVLLGTWIVAIILSIHWIDLGKRLKSVVVRTLSTVRLNIHQRIGQ